jgi:hypothetical protein
MEAEKMGESRRRGWEVVLWLALSACSSDDAPSLPAIKGDFDNPSAIGGSGAKGQGGTGPGTGRVGLDGACANGRITALRVSPKVALVLDGSCSMSTDYPANGQASATECTSNPRSRWTALRDALIDPQRGVVPKLEKVVAFGVVTFGTRGGCPIPGLPVEPKLENLARITQQLPMVQPGMYTPTGPALDWVYDNWIDAQGPDDRGAAQIVILATDGEPNSCGGGGNGGMGRGGQGQAGQAMTNYQPSIDAVKKGTMKGATTYVISLADASGPFHDHLQELANLGNPAAAGKAQLYEPSSPDQLASALETLAGAAVGCDIELNGAISRDDACSGMVTLDGMALKCNDPNGWALIDERNIRLQGSACQHLMTKNDSIVEASFTCSAFRPD